jgi:hypothetical protein
MLAAVVTNPVLHNVVCDLQRSAVAVHCSVVAEP